MRTIISQTIITNRIIVNDDDDRSNEALEEDFRNDPNSFPADDQPYIESDMFVTIEED